MISKICIQNFKSLKALELECGKLNLLTGLNGMGKSSLLQVLLLLRQSYDRGYLRKDGLTLKGDLVNIGVGRDALYQEAEKEEVIFQLDFLIGEESINHTWIFGYEENKDTDEYKYSDSDVIPYAEDAIYPQDLEKLSLFNSQFKYLHAERWVKDQYERSDFQVVRNRNLGKHGQYTAHYLAHFGTMKSEEVSDDLLYPGTDNKTLEFQVSAWMNEISPGTFVNASKIKGVDAIKLSYEFKTATGRTNEMSPFNVGFGITYVLPVIVLLLSARPGDVVLIENPESHLHSKGQSSIGRLMVLAAQKGVQLFVETHSDHILNGVCVAIHDNKLESKLANFSFFHKSENQIETVKYVVPVDEGGKVDTRHLHEMGVEGFFDQINKDLEAILFTPLKKQ